MKIMLDAGHYGAYNRSPADKRYYESKQMWLLHKKVGEELKKRGYSVGYTRTDINTDLEVTKRGKKAKGYDAFLSFHSNAVGGGKTNDTVDYPKVYYSLTNTPEGGKWALNLSQAIAKTMGTRQEGKKATKVGDKGLDYLGGLRGARAVGCPNAYLIEHSFHTNTAATRWLMEDKNLNQLAISEADAIDNLFHRVPEKVQYYAVPVGYTGNSISQALKLIAEDNSLSNRKIIGKANNIEGIGTAPGNTRMLNLLKKGKLIKPPVIAK
ncbi:MAG TPA: hypothetical protein DCY74_05675 [Clostridiales bacterium]|nr:hypothetical protein [Clostridiales bacterium]